MNHIYESERHYVLQVGFMNPDQQWILSDRDVWYRNPHYSGPEQPHPEFGGVYNPPHTYEPSARAHSFYAPQPDDTASNSADYPDCVPF